LGLKRRHHQGGNDASDAAIARPGMDRVFTQTPPPSALARSPEMAFAKASHSTYLAPASNCPAAAGGCRPSRLRERRQCGRPWSRQPRQGAHCIHTRSLPVPGVSTMGRIGAPTARHTRDSPHEAAAELDAHPTLLPPPQPTTTGCRRMRRRTQAAVPRPPPPCPAVLRPQQAPPPRPVRRCCIPVHRGSERADPAARAQIWPHVRWICEASPHN
jgi:hypothetical protein